MVFKKKDMPEELQNLTDRELLILTHERVKNIADRMDDIDDHEKRLTVLETKGKLFSTIWAVLAGTISGILANRL